MSHRALLAGLALAVALLFVAALLVGPAGLPPRTALAALFGAEGRALVLVMQEIRLPRALLAAAVGAALGLAGAAMQGLLRNPLAEPGLLGVSAAAALGAVIALQTGLAARFAPALPASALAGAGMAAALMLAVALPRGGTLALILAGIALSALAGAATALVLNLSPNPFAAAEIVFWTMGSLRDRALADLWLASPFLGLGAALVIAARRGLDALTLGEEAAASLGAGLVRLRLLVVLGTAALVGAATAVAGAVGFVGLVVPHLVRPLCGGLPSRTLPAAALGGAAMVLAADLATRLIAPERDLKLGVLTAIVGAPFFLHLVFRTARAEA
ncbi:MAG: iron ABC transporter permease [Rhodobacteraceae bacterium]|nr:iron ABC transporter permease [Paracoccaceae bacterium]